MTETQRKTTLKIHQTVDIGVGEWNSDLMQDCVQTLILSFLSIHFPCRQNVPFFPKALLTHPSVIQESHMGPTWPEWRGGGATTTLAAFIPKARLTSEKM